MIPLNRRVVSLGAVVAAGILMSAGAIRAEGAPGTRLALAGFRAAVSENPQVRQLEAFSDWQLPWSCDLGRGFGVRTFLTGSLGWIGDDDDDAPMGSLGASFRLSHDKLPVSFVWGSSPTFLGRNHLGGRDMGCALQFTSHIGLAWEIVGHVELGYRFQHMSNAGIGQDNPGLNSHVAWLGWRF